MSGVNVTQSARAFLAAVDDLKKTQLNRAAAIALNRAAEGVRVDASREIRSRFKVKVSVVNKAFSIRKASADHLEAVVFVRGRPLSLGNFSPRQVRAGVTVNVKGSRKLVRHAFLKTFTSLKGDEANAYQVVFVREGNARYPLKALRTVDVPGVFSLKEVQQIVRSLALDRFDKELRAAVRAIQIRG
jgi:hypothetical protein